MRSLLASMSGSILSNVVEMNLSSFTERDCSAKLNETCLSTVWETKRKFLELIVFFVNRVTVDCLDGYCIQSC